jgi:hypothetical protein
MLLGVEYFPVMERSRGLARFQVSGFVFLARHFIGGGGYFPWSLSRKTIMVSAAVGVAILIHPFTPQLLERSLVTTA